MQQIVCVVLTGVLAQTTKPKTPKKPAAKKAAPKKAAAPKAKKPAAKKVEYLLTVPKACFLAALENESHWAAVQPMLIGKLFQRCCSYKMLTCAGAQEGCCQAEGTQEGCRSQEGVERACFIVTAGPEAAAAVDASCLPCDT